MTGIPAPREATEARPTLEPSWTPHPPARSRAIVAVIVISMNVPLFEAYAQIQ